VEAGEREARLLDVRAGDRAVDAVDAGQQLQRQPEPLGAARQKAADGDAGVGHGRSGVYASASTSVSSPSRRRYSTLTAAVSRSRKTTTPSRRSTSRAASATDIGRSACRAVR